MKQLGRILICAPFILVATLAQGQIKRVGSGYLFRQKYTAGTQIKYITVVSQGMGGKTGISMTMPFLQRITAVSKNVASITVTVGPASLNGKPMGKTSSFEMRVNSQGLVVGGPQGAAQGVTAFPLKPIKVGQTWTAVVPAPGMGNQASTATATYKFLKMGSVKGKPVAVVAVSLSSQGGFALSGSGVSYLSGEDGSLIYNSMQLKAASPMSQGEPITINVLVKRG